MQIYSFVSENQYGSKSREWKHKHRFLILFFDFIPAVPVALAANRTVKRWLASSWAAIALFKTRPCSLNRRTAGILTSSLFPSSFDMANIGCVSLELPSTLSAAQKKMCSVAECASSVIQKHVWRSSGANRRHEWSTTEILGFPTTSRLPYVFLLEKKLVHVCAAE